MSSQLKAVKKQTAPKVLITIVEYSGVPTIQLRRNPDDKPMQFQERRARLILDTPRAELEAFVKHCEGRK